MPPPYVPKPGDLAFKGHTYVRRCGHDTADLRQVAGGLACETCGVKLERVAS